MTPDQFRQVEELYHAVRECPPEKRPSLLGQADPDVRREVETLLAQESAGGPMERPALELAADLASDSTITQMAGQTVGQYQVLEVLGVGGMGVVYKAFDTRLNRLVALKFLPPHLRYDTELKARLKAEARAASALDHPNIVVIHDIGETPGGELFIAMAFHEGATLRERIKAGLSVDQALQIARHVASGLARSS